MQNNLGKQKRNSSPFVKRIETNDDCRIYTFEPEIKKPFIIIVDLPHFDYGTATIKVSGEKIDPEILIDAIHFVTHNELKFSEAEDTSEVKKAFEPVRTIYEPVE